MLKNFYDRLVYALLGFIFGAILGAIVWWLYGAGMSARWGAPEIHLGLDQWIKYAGGGFAPLGFFFKDRAGSAVGTAASGIYELERAEGDWPELPRWLAVLLLLALLAGVWYWVRQA